MHARSGNTRPALVALAALVSLTACAGEVTVTGHRNASPHYEPSELYIVATGDNALRTVILGNPFDIPKPEFDAAVLAAIAGGNAGPRLNLATNPTREDARKRHVVLAFELARRGDADALCAGTAGATDQQPAGDTVTVTGVYCSGSLPLSQATARAGEVPGIASEQFRALMSQLALALFPTTSRRTQSGRE